MIITPLFIKGNKNGAQELTKFIDMGCVCVCAHVYMCCIYPKLYMSKYVYTGFLAYKLLIRHLYSFLFFFLSKNSKCVDILVARGQSTTTNGELKYLEIQEIEVV